MAELGFEWDEDKAASNVVKHGVYFERAILIFDSERIEQIDDRESYGEERIIALGRVGMEVYRVVYTQRGDILRMISAQKASKHERENYYRQIFT
jgi:hypothetical protein